MDLLNKIKRRPIGIDLFAGAGGLSLGFEQAGFDIAAAVEIDPIHSATHEYNFPYSTTICSSVVDLTGNKIRKKANLNDIEIDVVFGGAPCQGFSLIGKRSLEDPRNQLVFHFVRLVEELQPKYFVFENVKGLMLGKQAEFLNEFIEAFSYAGYNITQPYRSLNAADFGVPQDRQRLFVIGSRRNIRLPAYPNKLARKTNVWEAIGDLPDADLFEELKNKDTVVVKWNTKTIYARQLRDLESDPSNYAYRRIFDINKLTSSLRTDHTVISRERFIDTDHGKTEPISRFRKLSPDGLCNTLRAGTDSARGAFTSPRPIHPFLPRVITVREAARLHSYPDWFRFHVTKWHGFRQIGNSVPPLLARAVASEIIKALGVEIPSLEIKLQLGNPELLTLDMSSAAKYFGVPRNTIAQRTRKRNTNQYDLMSELHA